MKERAIVIFEKRKKKKRKRADVWLRTDGRDGQRAVGVTPFPFQSPTTCLSEHNSREKRVSIIGIIILSVYNRRNARIQVSNVMIQRLSCHVIWGR